MAVKFKDSYEEASHVEKLPIPEGTYAVKISSAEEKRNKSNTGTYIRLNFALKKGQLDSDKYAKEIVIYYNTEHQNPIAEKIGQESLLKCMLACSVPVDDSVEAIDFVGNELFIEVIRKEGKDGKTRPEIKSYITKNKNVISIADVNNALRNKKLDKLASEDTLDDEIPF